VVLGALAISLLVEIAVAKAAVLGALSCLLIPPGIIVVCLISVIADAGVVRITESGSHSSSSLFLAAALTNGPVKAV